MMVMARHKIDDAYQLQRDLINSHEGKEFDDVFQGERYNTSNGSCYKIEESEKIKIKRFKKDKIISRILEDIKLIPGIGHIKERRLKDEGYSTIKDLLGHPKYSKKAAEILNTLEDSPIDCIHNLCSKSQPYHLFSSSFRDMEDLIFFDIETMGLKDRPVILIGMAGITGNHIRVKQYLCTDLKDEKYVLEAFLSNLDNKTIFVSFNGLSFDLPFIKGRAYHHGLCKDLNFHHLDLLHFSRRIWGKTLPNCRLETLEKYLFNLQRGEDVPSSQVPSFYKKYLQTGNIGPLIPIVKHNKQDIITLANLLSRLQEEVVKN